MVAFDRSIKVLRVSKPISFIGVVDDKDCNCVLITLEDKVATKYQLVNRKEICQWNTKYSYKSCVVYDWTEDKYVGHFDESTVKMWSQSESFIDLIEPLQFKTPIHSVVSNINDSPVILFENGFASKLNKCIALREQALLQENLPKFERILNFDLLVLSKSKIIVSLVIEQQTSRNVLVYELINNNIENLRILDFQVLNLDLEAIFLARIADDSILFIQGSDRRLYSRSLTAKIGCGTLVENFDSLFESKMSIRIVDAKMMMVCGQTKDCPKTRNKSTLIAYNMKLQTVENEATFKNMNETHRMWVVRKNLFFVQNSNLRRIEVVSNKRKLDSYLCHLYENNCSIDNENRLRTIYLDSSAEIFDELMKEKDLNEIEKQINQSEDILENTLVKLLGFVVRNCDLKSINSENYDEKKCTLLNSLLKFTYDESQICSLLKNEFPDHETVCDFLRYLSLAKKEIKVFDWTFVMIVCFGRDRKDDTMTNIVNEILVFYTSPEIIEACKPDYWYALKGRVPIDTHNQNNVSNSYRIERINFNLQFD